MKKLLFGLLGLLLCTKAYAGIITVDAFITPDDVSIAHLETFRTKVVDEMNGNIDSANIEDNTVSEADMADNANVRVYFNDAFNDFVASGLLPPTSDNLTTTTTIGISYINGYYVTKDATAHTFTASKWTYIDLSQTGVYTYVETVHGAAAPAITSNSMRLARVSTDGTKVLAIRDDRVLSIATATNEDHYRTGFDCTMNGSIGIAVSPGVVYYGTTRLGKVSATTLNLTTATDWVGDVSLRGASTWGYIVVDSNGSIRLTTTAPTKADTSGNTTGILRYSVISSVYYRVLGWFYMDANQNIQIDKVGNFKDGVSVSNVVSIISFDTANYGTQNVYQSIAGMTADIYCTGKPISILFDANGIADSGITTAAYNISEDAVSKDSTEIPTGWLGAGSYNERTNYIYTYKPAQGGHKFNINYKPISGATNVNFTTRRLIIREE